MKLIKSIVREPKFGIGASLSEWWDLGKKYKIHMTISGDICQVSIYANSKNITYEVARHLGINTPKNEIKFGVNSSGGDLYLTSGLDCTVLNYVHPEKYHELLKKIEEIVDIYFKNNTNLKC